MEVHMKRWLPALGTFLGVLFNCSATACCERPIDQFLLFGDSYFDTGAGNAVAKAENLPLLAAPTPPWYLGRHSNGPIWIDYTSAALCIPFQNFAVSGAETGSDNFEEAGLGGIFQQIDRYTALESKIRPNTVVIMDGGGNDYFSLLNNPSDLNPAGVAAATQQAILNLLQDFTEIQALGAKKIVMWNLGDMGRLPIFTDPALGLTALSPLYAAATDAFNGALLPLIQTLNRYSHDEQQIYLFDAYTVFDEITAQLIAEGVNPVEHTITTEPGGIYFVTGPQPDQTEFYDQVHPTARAWELFSHSTSAFLDTLINGPRFVAAEQDLVFATSGAHRDAVDNHFRTLHAQRYVYCNNWADCSCCDENRFQLYTDIDAKWGCTSSRSTALGLDYNTQLALIGLDYSLNNCATIGCSFTAQTSHADVRRHYGHMRLNDFIPTLYGSFMQDDYFIDLATSYHFLDFKRLHRRVPFLCRTARGHMNGQAVASALRLGYVSQCGCLTLMPIIGIEFENICLRSYNEKGAGFVDLKMRRQHQNSLMTRIGAQLYWDSIGGCFTPFGELYYDYECLRNRHHIAPRLFKSNDGSKDFARVGCGRRNFLKYAAGVDMVLTECLSSNISYEGDTNFKNSSNSVRFQVDAAF
jgi:phospholipase/lecithinase/hemolysin/uncharacterized protein YhjY with autotransporter beta-barrel domain